MGVGGRSVPGPGLLCPAARRGVRPRGDACPLRSAAAAAGVGGGHRDDVPHQDPQHLPPVSEAAGLSSAWMAPLFGEAGLQPARLLPPRPASSHPHARPLHLLPTPTPLAPRSEKTLVGRERARAGYGVLPYLLSKLAAELPVGALFPALFGCLVYPATGLNPQPRRFGTFLGVLVLEAMSAQALGLAVGAAAPSTEAALAIGPAVILVSIVFGGLFVNESSVPRALKWLPAASLIKQSFAGMCINEFKGAWPAARSLGPCCVCTRAAARLPCLAAARPPACLLLAPLDHPPLLSTRPLRQAPSLRLMSAGVAPRRAKRCSTASPLAAAPSGRRLPTRAGEAAALLLRCWVLLALRCVALR